MKALVTGASGFLGSHIVESCLERGDDVRVLVRRSSDLSYLRTLSGVEIAYGDLASRDAVLEATRGVDVVYHSAARVTDFGSRRQFFDANVVGTRHLLETARENGAGRFVFVSSPSVVADDTDQIDVDESYPYPTKFQNLYSETKAIAEQMVLAQSTPRFLTCSLRPRGIWGPRDWNGFMPKLLSKMRTGKFPDLSGGKRVFASLCYCKNAAAACTLAARSDRVGGKAYFVTDGVKTDVWQFAARLAADFSFPPITKRIPPALLNALVGLVELVWKIPYLANRYSPPISRYGVGLLTRSGTYDIGAAERDFGYRPEVDSETGLARLKAWIEEIGGVDQFIRCVK